MPLTLSSGVRVASLACPSSLPLALSSGVRVASLACPSSLPLALSSGVRVASLACPSSLPLTLSSRVRVASLACPSSLPLALSSGVRVASLAYVSSLPLILSLTVFPVLLSGPTTPTAKSLGNLSRSGPGIPEGKAPSSGLRYGTVKVTEMACTWQRSFDRENGVGVEDLVACMAKAEGWRADDLSTVNWNQTS